MFFKGIYTEIIRSFFFIYVVYENTSNSELRKIIFFFFTSLKFYDLHVLNWFFEAEFFSFINFFLRLPSIF